MESHQRPTCRAVFFSWKTLLGLIGLTVVKLLYSYQTLEIRGTLRELSLQDRLARIRLASIGAGEKVLGSLKFGEQSGTTVGHSNMTNQTAVTPTMTICPRGPAEDGRFSPSLNRINMSDIDDKYSDVTLGGHWTPAPRCRPRNNVAIVIPFRARESHLPIFLDNMHRFLQLQSLEYTIYIVEQAPGVVFNRALLMNVGYLEAKKIRHYDCYVFHDIDMIPVDIRNVYDCPNNPRHLAVARDKSRYRLPYYKYFGGGVVLRPDHLEKMNGFTNIMYGWGGEDDEAYSRIKKAGLKLERYPSEIGRYRSISFDHKDSGNPKSLRSFHDVDIVNTLSRRDGLNSIKYKLLSLNKYPLYTRIVAQCDGPRMQDQVKPYMKQQMAVLRKQIEADKTSINKSTVLK